jgi:hypothetical protein
LLGERQQFLCHFLSKESGNEDRQPLPFAVAVRRWRSPSLSRCFTPDKSIGSIALLVCSGLDQVSSTHDVPDVVEAEMKSALMRIVMLAGTVLYLLLIGGCEGG